jgi:hypothetical protein
MAKQNIEHRLILSDEDFAALVAVKEIKRTIVGGTVKIILSNIDAFRMFNHIKVGTNYLLR